MAEATPAAAASASTRCARPDCISLREELELLRGDLQEIESENEQLHEKIAQMDGEKQTRSQGLMREQSMFNEKIAEKDSEIARLNQVARELSAKLKEEQQVRVGAATGSSSAVPVAGGEQGDRMSRLEQECIELRGKNEALEKRLEELRAANARELNASVSAKHAVEQMTQESKDKRSELYKVLKENEMLRTERSELEDALRTTADAAFENESLVKVMYEHQNAYKEAIDEQTIEITQLHTKLEQLEREKQHLEAKLIEMDERESDVEVLLRDAKMKHDMEKAVLRNELDEQRKKVQELSQQQQKQRQLSAASKTGTPATGQVVTQATLTADTEEMENQLELLQELRIRDKNTISELNQRILQQQSDVESLMEHLDVDAVIESAVQSAVAKEQAENVNMRQENVNIKRRLKEQSELLHEMEFRQSQLEKELVEAQTWNAKYEQNAGLEDVMKFQKQLRKQLEKQQQANVKLRHDLNEQTEATGKIHVAFERLKVETGKPPEFEYDDITVENHLKGELAVNQAVMAQMEHQIQELEADRVRLLQKLREQARLTGHKLYEAHGVTTEQWQLVEEFIDRVKHTPEVAKRLLLSSGEVGSGTRGTEGSAGAAGQPSEDAVVKYETEIANSHAENMKLVKEIARLRSESEHAQAASASIHTLPGETPRADKESSEDLKAIREQIQLIVKEQEMQRSHRDLLLSGPPRENKKATAAAAVDTLVFESEEEMTLQLDVLKELNVCLDELVRSETQNEELQQQLAQHEQGFKSLTDQHTVLYQHFFHMHAEYSKSDEDLQREVAEMKYENHDLQLKCQRYESSLHMFAKQHEGSIPDPEAQLRSEIVELTRKTAIYEVNEARFRRKYQQLYEDLQGAVSQKKMLEQDWLDMEKTLKYRILYLESWKEGADELIERMERTLEKSVLKTFAERQEQAMIQVLHKYNALSEAYSEMHVKFVQMHDLPSQLSRVQHENAVLLAEKRAHDSGGSKEKATSSDKISIDPILQARISQLEHELAVQTQRVKDFEEAQASRVTAATGGGPASALGLVSMHAAVPGASEARKLELYESDLEKENGLLFERISEVEQLYESLTRECAKYKDIAALAATQANTLAKRATQEKSKQEDQLRDLMVSSDDHAVVGQLQHQLMQLKANYQQFLLKYDTLSEDQQHATIKAQQLELELETRSKLLSDLRDKSRNQVAVLETTISQVKERDLTVRSTKWEAFRKRLDALEEEMKLEQERRKELEKELEAKEAQLPLFTNLKRSSADGGQSLEVNRLKSRVEALETRERVLMGQLESAAKSATYLEQEEMLQAELADTKKLSGDVMRQLKAAQARISDLIKQNGDLDANRRQLANEKEDLEIELQHVHAQLELLGGDGTFSVNNQRSNQSGSHSPLMRKKVGLYEKDQAELQQAAQATIASLKLLVEEKNGLIQEYQKKMAMVRHDAAQVKAQDRLETTQLNKKLYEENQRMISQLKEAMDTIKHLERTGKDKKAIQAAQERHEYVLKEWKQVEISLEKAKQTIKELQMEIEVLKNERDIAEARAGEALEEIVLTKDIVAEQEMINKQLETQLGFSKRDLGKKEDKMKLLRDAIIKLKEEFLKAEDRHAVEIAKAQQAASVNNSRKKKDHREEEEQWREEKERLESQVHILQEKLELMKKQEAKLKRAVAAANAGGRTDTQKASKRDEAASAAAQDAAQVKILEDEIERLKRVVKERVVGEARVVEDLEKKSRVLEAQNMALREASVSQSLSTATRGGVAGNERSDAERRASADTASKTREQWEVEKKLQRRNDILMLRLKEKHAELDEKEKELEQTKERLAIAQQEQAQLKKAEQKRATVSATAADGSSSISASAKEQIDELGRQNRYLQETLVLKRREWEDAFTEQMTKYEKDLKRLRRRLSQHGVPAGGAESDERRRGERQSAERLRLEEQQFLISQEVNDELVVLGDELRAKEQEIILKDTKMMEMELELETLRVEYKRMQRRTSILESSQQQQPQVQQQGLRRGQAEMKGKPTSSIRSPAQERFELEEVIENMKKVIEKLRSENEKLKKHSVSPGKMDVLRRKLKEHRDAREQLEGEVEALRTENAEVKKEKLRLQQKLRVASSTLTTGAASGAGAAPKSSVAEQELRDLRSQVQDQEERLAHAETEARELKRAIARKEAQVQELQFQLEHFNQELGADGDAAAVNDEIIRELEDHVQELEDENSKLQSELAAFDEDFFEEIEDLKYKYAQAVREKQQLERRLLSK
ncbi:putative centrosome-associated protein [Globisporangium polare]